MVVPAAPSPSKEERSHEHRSTWKKQLEPQNTRTTRKQNGLEKEPDSPNGRRRFWIQLLFLSRIWRVSRFELPDLGRMIPKRFLLVASTFLLAVLLYVDRVCISTAKGPVTKDLGLTDEQFGWILSAFALGYALLQTPTGALSDRFGPRRVLTAVVTLWSLFTGLTAASWNFVSMLVIRFLFGAGEAGAFPGMARAIFAWLPMKERGVATGVNFAGGRLGAAFAMPAVAAMIEWLGGSRVL